MTHTQATYTNRIALRAGKKGARPAEVGALASVFEKSATELKQSKLLKCKQTLQIATFNVRTLNRIGQLPELIASAEEHKIDIICIQEHRYTHTEDIKYHETGNGWSLATVSAWKNSVNATVGGVGLLIGPRALKTLNSVEKIQPRMMAATFNGNPRATIISCYSPTNVSEENEIVTFYDELSSLVRSIPKHNMLVIGGDMNAQIGKNGNNKYSLHNTSNRNGQHLTDFMIENRLACLNTNYQKREGKLWTYTYANNTKAQIDYVLINKKWKNSALNCEAYSSFESVSTDHRIVTAKIRLSLRKNDKRTATTKHYDWALLYNKDVRDKYVLELRNRFETLQEKTEKSTPNDEYENFVNAHLEAAAKYIPTKIKTKYRVPWETLAVREKRALVKTASKNYRKNPTNTNALKLKTAQYQLAGIYIKEQTEYIQNQIDKIRDSVEDRESRIAWQTINEVSRRKNTAKAKLKAANQQERIKLWKQHFENLLGNPPKITHEPITRIISKQLDIKLGPFTQEELDLVLRKIKNRKAAGLDEIPPEVWKTRQFDDILLRHCNAVYNQNPIDRWTKGCILPFPKKGDLGLAKNYRGITLTSIAAKIYNALLRNRIEPKIDNILRKNQNGFRRNRSTTSQILTIRRILEGVRANNLQATLIFVDFTSDINICRLYKYKAFDSIHRGKMEQILLAYGIPKETVAAITILYRNTKVKVRSPDGDTEYFDIVAGVLQGDTLAPYLFIICLDYVLRTSIDKIKENGFELTKKRSRRYPATTITDADYADDIAILANIPDQAETLLHSLERAAASIGLHVNAHKTEYMCYNQTGDISTLKGTTLKLVDKFTYLGSSVESTEKDIETRLTKAWTAINRLSSIWKSDLTDKMKRSFFQAAVTSILLYGCTTWTLTKRLEKKLDGNYTRMLRAILNKSWQQHPTRHQLYGHLPPITKTIQVRRTRHAGHCWRSRDELIRDVPLWIPTHGRAKAGRPARTYIQQLCEDTGCCPEDLPRAMNDREEWRERVRDIRAASTIWWWWWLLLLSSCKLDCKLTVISCEKLWWWKRAWNQNLLLLLLLLYLRVFHTSFFADGFTLEFEWQQVSSNLRDSSQYSGRCCCLDSL